VSSEPVSSDDAQERPEPHLRLVEGLDEGINIGSDLADSHGHHLPTWDSAQPEYTAHVLIAGANAAARTHMLEELADLLPAETRFAHASETWEVIAASSTSSMVVLAGDLGDVSGESMMRLLGRRYPTLPVLAVAEKTPTHTAADVGVAHA
jgi:hypothetical protein